MCIRKCIICEREINGRHLKCSRCRYKSVNNKCVDCGTKVSSQSERCIQCYTKNIKGISTPLDKYTGFREFIRRAKNRNKLGLLTLDDLIEQWIKQNMECPYTGIRLKLPSYKNKNNSIETASLDRINSEISYQKGNIQFVSTAINYMKGSMTHEETLVLCKIISKFWNKDNGNC